MRIFFHRYYQKTRIFTPAVLVFVIPIFVLGPIFHELGHIIVGILQGSSIEYFEILGFSFYPDLRFAGFDGAFGRVQFDYEYLNTAAAGYRLLAGSSFTLLISVLSIAVMYLMRFIKQTTRIINFAFSLYFVDILADTFLPKFDLGHFGLGIIDLCPTSCDYSEVLAGVRLIGFHELIFQIGVGLISLVLVILIVARVVLSKRAARMLS